MQNQISDRKRIIRKPELLNIIGLSDPTIWRMEKMGKFPKRLRLGGNSCGWLETEVNKWIEGRLESRSAVIPERHRTE